MEFVGVLAGRPEEWLQCPVPLDGVSDLSETQGGHVKMIEHLVPSLAALRVSLCPSRLSEGSFWTIYFFLLHPRLSKCDSELLSTTQIVEEMDRGLQELRNRIIARLESYKALPYPTGSDKRSVIQDADNQVQEEVSSNTETTSSSWVNAVEQDNIDQWLEEDGVLLIPADGRKPLGSEEDGVLLIPSDGRKQLGSETDVSFSDLECDDSHVILKRPTSSSSLEVAADSSACSSSEWVPLKYRSGSQYRGNKKPVPSTFEQEAVDGESSDWVSANDSD